MLVFSGVDKYYTLVYNLYIMSAKKTLTTKQSIAIRHIRNWLAHRGKMPSVRELMTAMGYKSPRSVTLIYEELIKKGILKRRSNGSLQFIKDPESDLMNARTINIPLIGTVTCGMPILAQENIEGFIPVSVNLACPGFKYFLLRAKGDSMNKAGINDGDLMLVRQQSTADNGDKVVALIDDEATVKEFNRGKETIILKPRSNNNEYKPIILTEDFQVQGVVITTIPNMED